MSHLIDEINAGKRDVRVRQIAASLLKKKTAQGAWQVQERDWDGEVAAAFHFVRQNVRYTRDPYEAELFQKPRRTLELGIGDCDDISILLGSILQNIGYPVILRIIGLRGGTYQHVYVMAGIPPHAPTRFVPLDASRGEGPGWELEEGVTLKTDYLVEDAEST